MKIEDEVAKFADLTEQIRKMSVKVEETKEQNRAYESVTDQLGATKSGLLEEIKQLKEEKRGLGISRTKVLKGYEISKKNLKEVDNDVNRLNTEKNKLLSEIGEAQKLKEVLLEENSKLVLENKAIKEEMYLRNSEIEQSMKTLLDLQEQLEVKEMLLRNRERKLDLREEALN